MARVSEKNQPSANQEQEHLALMALYGEMAKDTERNSEIELWNQISDQEITWP